MGVSTKTKTPYNLIVILVICFSGLRYNVGVDYNSYVNIFQYETFTNEIGYYLLVKFIKNTIGGTQQLIFLLYAFLTVFLVSKFIYKNSPYPYFSLLIYIMVPPFFLGSLSGMRHHLAIALFAYATRFIIENRPVYYITLLFLGGLFAHFSLFFLIPLFLLGKKALTIKDMGIVLTLSIVLSFLMNYLVTNTVYSYYLDTVFDVEVSIRVYVFLIIALGVALFNRKEIYLWMNFNFMSIVCIIILLMNTNLPNDIFLRMNNYFLFFQIILIPYIISLIKYKYVRALLILCLMIGVGTYYFTNTTLPKGKEFNLLPYDVNYKFFK